MFLKRHYLRQDGFTLIEVITTIVVLSIAATAILSVFSGTIRSSANPMIQQQAISVAEAYMEEIMTKSFNDPGGPGVESRASFDDVLDYNDLEDDGARDQNDNLIASLADYTVTVSVVNAPLHGIASTEAFLITVNVTHTALGSIVLSGYRTNY